jgi:hypothetical protein
MPFWCEGGRSFAAGWAFKFELGSAEIKYNRWAKILLPFRKSREHWAVMSYSVLTGFNLLAMFHGYSL